MRRGPCHVGRSRPQAGETSSFSVRMNRSCAHISAVLDSHIARMHPTARRAPDAVGLRVRNPTGGDRTVKPVTVWRNLVLPNSETFIANQIRAMRRWRPVLVGQIAVENSLGVVPAFTTLGYGHPLLVRSAAGVYRYTGTTPRLHRQFRRSALIHAHFGPDALGIVTAARRARRPLVATFHGYDITTLKQGVDIDYRPLFDRADRLIAQSNFIRTELLGAGAPDEKVHILPIGIPLVPDPPHHSDQQGRFIRRPSRRGQGLR